MPRWYYTKKIEEKSIEERSEWSFFGFPPAQKEIGVIIVSTPPDRLAETVFTAKKLIR
jgi:hypothetical protein